MSEVMSHLECTWYMPTLSKSLAVHLRRKEVALETSRFYSGVCRR